MRARYARAVTETWRKNPATNAQSTLHELVRYACLAASSHNTQPWQFELGRDFIKILPDFSRRCPAVDPDDHHLYASLGCAAENLAAAADVLGLRAVVGYEADPAGIRVDLDSAAADKSALFDALLRRQCTRTAYDGKPLSSDEQRILESVSTGNGVSVLLLTSDMQKDEVAQYVAQGNSVQFADRAWADELRKWIRFDAQEAIRTGDGLYGPVMGNPNVPPWLGKLFMRVGFSAEAQNRKDTRNIRSSSAIAVIHSEKNDPQHWMEAGRCYERLALQAAALDLRTAFINQPVEVGDLRPQFARYLGIGDRRPDLIVRIGHAPLGPKSLRRPLADVIVGSRV